MERSIDKVFVSKALSLTDAFKCLADKMLPTKPMFGNGFDRLGRFVFVMDQLKYPVRFETVETL